MPHVPTLEGVKKLVADASDTDKKQLVPICLEVMADMETPVSAYLKLRREGSPSFLFESVEGAETLARYSYIGFKPTVIVKTGDADSEAVDPLIGVEKTLAELKSYEVAGLPPFTGGAVGYVGYDCVKYFEPRTAPKIAKQKNTLGIPESIFMYCQSPPRADRHRYALSL